MKFDNCLVPCYEGLLVDEQFIHVLFREITP